MTTKQEIEALFDEVSFSFGNPYTDQQKKSKAALFEIKVRFVAMMVCGKVLAKAVMESSRTDPDGSDVARAIALFEGLEVGE